MRWPLACAALAVLLAAGLLAALGADGPGRADAPPVEAAGAGAGPEGPGPDAAVVLDVIHRPWPADALPGPGLHAISIPVAGGQATGLLAVPAGEPTTLAILAHGWGRGAADHRADLERLAGDGVLAAAMDFRGDPSAFKVRAGVEDTLAVTQALQSTYPSLNETMLYGWSMGAEVALLAASQAPAGTYDFVFAGSGVSDLAEFWAQPAAQPAVEAETGGRPDEVPQEYDARSPVRLAPAIAAAGLGRVFLVHGEADAIVPVDQTERLFEALVDAGQATSMYVVTLDDLRMDCIHAACPPTLPGPGTHDAGLFRILQPFLLHRVQGLPLPQALAQRGTYDGSSGYYEPSDVATVEQALGGVFVFGWQLDWGHDGAGGVHGKPFDMPAGIARITVDAEWTCRDDCALRLVTGKAGVSSLATTGVGRARLVVDQPEPGPWSISLSPEGVTSDVRGLVRYSLDPA